MPVERESHRLEEWSDGDVLREKLPQSGRGRMHEERRTTAIASDKCWYFGCTCYQRKSVCQDEVTILRDLGFMGGLNHPTRPAREAVGIPNKNTTCCAKRKGRKYRYFTGLCCLIRDVSSDKEEE
ncbi:unnamed protein product [Ilex paraguariensis]|uniref:Uncharacterized protein n=1 Tax=Ilex paraguariensis TaxID=185542 RepID=A0ABC8RZV4_9AQUA